MLANKLSAELTMKRLIFKICLLGPGKDVFRCFLERLLLKKYCQENCDPNEGLVDFNNEPPGVIETNLFLGFCPQQLAYHKGPG